MKLHGFSTVNMKSFRMLIFVFYSFTEDEHATVAKGVDHDYESENSDCDSLATYSSGEFVCCFHFHFGGKSNKTCLHEKSRLKLYDCRKLG
jgi:hypothetical protein